MVKFTKTVDFNHPVWNFIFELTLELGKNLQLNLLFIGLSCAWILKMNLIINLYNGFIRYHSYLSHEAWTVTVHGSEIPYVLSNALSAYT